LFVFIYLLVSPQPLSKGEGLEQEVINSFCLAHFKILSFGEDLGEA